MYLYSPQPTSLYTDFTDYADYTDWRELYSMTFILLLTTFDKS